MRETMRAAHLSDEQLVRLLDGELGPADARFAQRHIDDCAGCRHRYVELQQSAAAVDAVLDADPVGEPSWRPHTRSRPHRAGWLGAAVAAALVILLLVPAARAGIIAQVQRLMNLAGGNDTTTTAPPASRIVVPGGTSLRFPIREDTLTIELRSFQQAGWIEVARTGGDVAEASMLGSGSGDFTVLPGTLVIENDRGSTTPIRVHIPADVQLVVVLVAGAERGRLDAVSDRLLLPLNRQP